MEYGSLGVKNVNLMNTDLLCKWQWRFPHSRSDLWRIIIAEKYGKSQGEWKTLKYSGSVGSSIWPSICKVEDFFWDKARYKVHSGTRVLLWKHLWCGEMPL